MKKKLLLPLAFIFAAGVAWAADALTTHYSLVQPQVGASINSWGTKLNSDLVSLDSLIWSASGGTTIGVNTSSSAANITLTNPINNVQNITLSTTSKKLILPVMNATSSLVVGGTLYVHNSGSNTFDVTAQDGSTVLISALAAGGNAYLTLTANGTANGTFNTVVPAAVSGGVLGVASGGTGTSTTFTQGSVAFAGVSGVYTQDNANFFWDDTNNRLGIGTATPASTLSVTGNATVSGTLGVTGVATLGNGSVASTQTAGDNTNKIATTAFVTTAIAGATGVIVPGEISGCLPSGISGSSTTATMSISACTAADSTGAVYIKANSATWNVSNGNAINGYQGGTTLPSSTTVHFFEVSGGSGTGFFASTSTSPTLPTGYTTSFRRIFSIRTAASTTGPIPGTAIETEGGSIIFYLTTQLLDVNSTSLGSSSRTLFSLTVPNGIKVGVLYRSNGGQDGSSQISTLLMSADETDVAPTDGTFWWATVPGADLKYSGPGTGTVASPSRDGLLTTNTSGQIGARALSGTGNALYLVTRGWKDYRRN